MKQIPPFRNRRDVFYLVHEEPTKESENGIYIVKPKDNSYRAIWAVVWDVPLKLMSTSDGYTKEEVDKIISTIKDYQKENDKLLENIKLEISKLNSKKADRTELANVVAGLLPMGSVANLTELEAKPKRNNYAYFVEDQLSPEGNAYIYRWDDGFNIWVNTKQVVFKDVITQGLGDSSNKVMSQKAVTESLDSKTKDWNSDVGLQYPDTRVYDGVLWRVKNGVTTLSTDIPNKTSDKWEMVGTKIELDVDGGAASFKGQKIYETDFHFGGFEQGGQGVSGGFYVVPYYIGGTEDYIIKQIDFSIATLAVDNPIPFKLFVMDVIKDESDNVISATVVEEYPLVLDVTKVVDVDLKIKGNQVFGCTFKTSPINTMYIKYKNIPNFKYIPLKFSSYPNIGDTAIPVPPPQLFDLSIKYYIIKADSKYELLNDVVKRIKVNDITRVDVSNVSCIYATGSSLTASLYCPYGYSPLERVNDFIDMPIVNDARSGYSRFANYRDVAYNSRLARQLNVFIQDIKYSHILWCNSANNSKRGLAGIEELKRIKYLTESLSAKMILSTEEKWDTGTDELFKSFSASYNIPYCDINSLSYLCYPSNIYPDTMKEGHKGWRAVAPYIALRKFLDSLYIKQTIKMYKIRDYIIVNNVSDLIYENNIKRAEMFHSLNPSSQTRVLSDKIVDFTLADNINNVSYAINGDTIDGDGSCEEARFLSGQFIDFNGYALIEFIIDNNNPTNIKIGFESSTLPENVYLYKHTYGNTFDNILNTIIENVNYDIIGNRISVSINNTKGYCIDGKIRLLIKKEGDFKIKQPYIEFKGNASYKRAYSENIPIRKFGKEIRLNTSCVDINTSGDAVIESFPTGLKQYPIYNDSGVHLRLINDGKGIIEFSSSSKKMAVRIVAQTFIPYMTKRYTETLYDNYVEHENTLLHNRCYDYNTLRVTINQYYVFEEIVQTGWHEIYFEFDTSYYSNGVFSMILEKVDNTKSFVNQYPILIYDVSVQEISN